MDKEILKSNLLNCIGELGMEKDAKIKFRIVPVVESGKNLNSTDDYMRLTVLTEKNLNNRYLDLDKVTNILSGPNSTFPIWINIKIISNEDEECVVELQISQRFRKPSLLQNQETGHPPFRAIKK